MISVKLNTGDEYFLDETTVLVYALFVNKSDDWEYNSNRNLETIERWVDLFRNKPLLLSFIREIPEKEIIKMAKSKKRWKTNTVEGVYEVSFKEN